LFESGAPAIVVKVGLFGTLISLTGRAGALHSICRHRAAEEARLLEGERVCGLFRLTSFWPEASRGRRRLLARWGFDSRVRGACWRWNGSCESPRTMNSERIGNVLEELRCGGLVVVADDEDRENEGDLIMAAEKVTLEQTAFMVRHTSGLICVALEDGRATELDLPPMVARNGESQRTAFTVSVDLKRGISTGISAMDRSATICALASRTARASDFVRPGHVFPLRAKAGGVLERRGHTEAAADLMRIAGLQPAGVLCELVDDRGGMLRGRALRAFARKHRLPFLTIEDLAAYRRCTEPLVEHVSEARLPTRYGLFRAYVYCARVGGQEHVALVHGQVRGASDVLVRVHSECLTGDAFASVRCDCREQLDVAMQSIVAAGSGVIVYLRGHEGRGIGLGSKLAAYQLQDAGYDTVEANLALGLPVDSRSYAMAAQILTDLGPVTLRLMSNNPAKFSELEGHRLKIVERVPLITAPTAENVRYLRTKQHKLDHRLELPLVAALREILN
jgi:3,4-dihydroxy 2-butanone 4-phosphate synthase/GTP cyclohydrolase II